MNAHTVLPERLRFPGARPMDYCAGLLLQIALFDSLFSLSGMKADDGGVSRQLLWGFLGTAGLVYLVVQGIDRHRRTIDFGGLPVAFLFGYVFLSAAWSAAPDSTVKRALVLSFVVIVAATGVGGHSTAWNKDEFSRKLVAPLFILLGLSVLLTVVAPGRAFTDIGWRGISSHKNEAGQMMAVATLLLLYGSVLVRQQRALRYCLLGLCVLFLILAKSTTSLLGLILGVGITEVLTLGSTFTRCRSWKALLLGALLVGSALLFVAHQCELLPTNGEVYSRLLNALGKSETLTGRTAIWEQVLVESRFHNVLIGTGYGGFWVGPDSISGYVRVGDGLYPGQAHNGYLDIYNELGVLGLGLLSGMLVVGAYRVQRLFALGHVEAKLHLAILLMCLFLNLGESTFFRNSQFMNIVYFASFVRTFAILRQARMAAKQQDRGGEAPATSR